MKPSQKHSWENNLAVLGGFVLLILLVAGMFIFIFPAALISRNLAASLTSKTELPNLRILEESSRAEVGVDSSFWLNSGGWASIDGNVIKTITGSIPSVSYWRLRYRVSNPLDTDQGYRPQNIFRLITHTALVDSEQSVYTRILAIAPSKSPNRNESNGILLMSRYEDNDNLYYAGIRVDGYAVIKRKRNGHYETLALSPLWNNPESPYHPTLRPNLLPQDTWIGLKLITRSRADGSTELTLYLDTGGTWETIAQAKDDRPLAPQTATRGGIRSDFMDAEFRGYEMRELQNAETIP